MPEYISPATRTFIWKLMTDTDFKRSFKQGGAASSAKDAGLDLSGEEIERLDGLDLDDLDAMLTTLERDMTVVMGGSRPRAAIALSSAAIEELRSAIEDARRLD